MAFDPNRRLSAEEALKHPYFSTHPLATPFPNLPRPNRVFGDEGGGGGGGGGGDDRGGRGGGGGANGGGGGGGERGDGSDLMPPPGARGGGGSPGSTGGGGDAKRGRFAAGAATAPRAGDAAHFAYDHHSPSTERRVGRGGDHGDHPMSTGGGGPHGFGDGSSSEFMGLDSCDRPALNTVDRAYLRKRKLELDNAFLAASQDFSEGFSQGLEWGEASQEGGGAGGAEGAGGGE